MSFVPPPIPAVPPLTPPDSLTEFQYHSQFSMDLVGVVIHVAGVPTDVDSNIMSVSMYPVAWPGTTTSGGPVFTRSATHAATGVYEITFLPADTSIPGYYRLDWSFHLATVADIISEYIHVGQASPAYDTLPPEMQTVVEDVWIKFADIFDSPFGGPSLQIWFQTRFGRGRIAQLLRQCVQKLNTLSQPYTNFTVDGVNGRMFPVTGNPNFAGLLNSALTVEVIRHLMRSYVEDPEIQGDTKARVSRRDYLQRWGTMLADENAEYRAQLDVWKISQMFAGSPRVLASGGVFGNYGPTRLAGSAAARPRYFARFY